MKLKKLRSNKAIEMDRLHKPNIQPLAPICDADLPNNQTRLPLSTIIKMLLHTKNFTDLSKHSALKILKPTKLLSKCG
jgi:hypothetical protein